MTYLPDGDSVLLCGDHKPARLPMAQVHRLLDVFESVGAETLFNDLYGAASQCEGFIPRVSCFRKAS